MSIETQVTSASSAPPRNGLRSLVGVLRRRWWVILAAISLTTAAAIVRSAQQDKQYTATAALLFRDPQLDQKFFGSSFFAPTNDAQREAATNVQLVSLNAIARRTADSLGARGIRISAAEINRVVAVESAGQSDVVDVRATRPSPNGAAILANAFARSYIEFRRDNDRAKVSQAEVLLTSQLRQLPAQSERAVKLEQQLEQLGVLKALQTGNAELVQTAVPPDGPSSPRPKRSAAIGLFLGLLLAAILTLLLERFDRRIRDIDEIQRIFGRPILSAVAVNPALGSGGQASAKTRALMLEPFRLLRANLAFFSIGSQRKAVIVTSGSPGDGKTTAATNLAIAAAAAGQRVILVEADLRRPRLNDTLPLEPGSGLSEVLSGQADVKEAVRSLPLSQVTGADSDDQAFHILAAGATPPNPAELIGGDEMADLVTALEDQYDLVVIDTPPITVVSDAVLLLRRDVGVIVVVRLDKTTRDVAVRLREQLATIGVEPLGVVVNAVSVRTDGYGYGYYGAENYTMSGNGHASAEGRSGGERGDDARTSQPS